MVRLVFRPYRQVWRAICTSASLRASTRVSSGFTLLTHSSPSFGSQQICSYSNLSKEYPDRSMVPRYPEGPASHLSKPNLPSLSFRIHRFLHLHTRIFVRLLGPCFKTGRLKPLCQHPSLNQSSTLSAQSPTQTIGFPIPCTVSHWKRTSNQKKTFPQSTLLRSTLGILDQKCPKASNGTVPMCFCSNTNWCWPACKTSAPIKT